MALDTEAFDRLCIEAEQLVLDGQRLYDGCCQDYIKASPKAVQNPTEFRSQIQDLFRGMFLKIIHGMVLADRKLTSNEVQLCRRIFTQLWQRPFTDDNVKAVLIKHAQQDPYRWEDLLWPFERLPAFRTHLAEFETLALRLAQLLRRADGQSGEAETNHLRWVHSELQRILHPIRVDVNDDSQVPPPTSKTQPGKKTAQQVKSAVAQQEALKPLAVPADLVDLDSLLKELDDLVGLTAVKRDVKELVHFLAMQKQRQQHGLPVTRISLHAIFSGNPGTGKTTVARLYGKLLGSLGFLQKGHLIETDRGGLVAEYAGQTATKVNARIDEALDGVLFIDEAYSLVNDGEDPYGAEAVQTLLKRMEDQRERMVVILAGYPEPMENLLSTNPGLASRFGRTLHFADYSPVELCRIFASFCQRDSYALPSGTRASLIDGLTCMWKARNERFGNGRLARNLFEASLRRLATRLSKIKAMSKALLSTIDANDLALDDVPEDVKKQIGQHQYEIMCFSCAKPLRISGKQLGTEIVCPACQKAQKVEWGEQVIAN
jgi:SpoVK/Ycf46/Vps4 family AAA+-type ATPase